MTTFADVIVDGERVRGWVMARVIWPRASYVRARVLGRQDAIGGSISVGDRLDIPRDAIASVVHLTGPPAPTPELGTC